MATKKNITVSIDVDVYERAKARGARLSTICNDAVAKWLGDNLTQDELATKAAELQISAREMAIKLAATTINKATFESRYLTKVAEKALRDQGFNDEEISKIFEVARA